MGEGWLAPTVEAGTGEVELVDVIAGVSRRKFVCERTGALSICVDLIGAQAVGRSTERQMMRKKMVRLIFTYFRNNTRFRGGELRTILIEYANQNNCDIP